MKAVILAGGTGSRLSEETDTKPKPMVEVGGLPILLHIMNIYAYHGIHEFIIALGYKGDVIKNYFRNTSQTYNNMVVDFNHQRMQWRPQSKRIWTIHLVDTGSDAGTGGRLKKLSPLIGTETFCMTYGDGVANLPLPKILNFHKKQRKLATVTAVRPPARFGGLEMKGHLVTKFVEKPQIGEGWINGGFFVLEPDVLGLIKNDFVMFEQYPLEKLAKDKELSAYKHTGFWQCVDTLRDLRLLNELWTNKQAPWKIWKD